MSQTVQFEGATHIFPDDFSQDEISAALGAAHPQKIPGMERLGGIAPPPHGPSTSFVHPVSANPIDVGLGSPGELGPNSNPDVPMWARELGTAAIGAAAGVSPQVSGGVRPSVSNLGKRFSAGVQTAADTPISRATIPGGIGALAGGALARMIGQPWYEGALPGAALGSKLPAFIKGFVEGETPGTAPEPFRPNPSIQRQINRTASGGAGVQGKLSLPTPSKPAIPGGAAPETMPEVTPQAPEPFKPNPRIAKQLNRGASGGTGPTYRLKPPPGKPSTSTATAAIPSAPVDDMLEGLAKSQTGKSFAKLSPEQQQTVRDLAQKINPGASAPSAPALQPPPKPALEPPPGTRAERLHQQGGKTFSQYAEAKNQTIAKYLKGEGVTPEQWDKLPAAAKEAHIRKANPKYTVSSENPRGFGRTATQLYSDIGEALRELGN